MMVTPRPEQTIAELAARYWPPDATQLALGGLRLSAMTPHSTRRSSAGNTPIGLRYLVTPESCNGQDSAFRLVLDLGELPCGGAADGVPTKQFDRRQQAPFGRPAQADVPERSRVGDLPVDHGSGC
jgi:hypothetical protein